MKHLSRETRNEIAQALEFLRDEWISYRQRQRKHPIGGLDVRRGIATIKINRLKSLIDQLKEQ